MGHILSKIYRIKSIRKTIFFIPFFMLNILLLSIVYYNYFDNTYYKIYPILTSIFGSSTIFVFCYGFILSKYKYCLYSKISWLGLLYYNIINLTDSLFNFNSKFYFDLIEISGVGITLIIALIYIFKKNKS